MSEKRWLVGQWRRACGARSRPSTSSGRTVTGVFETLTQKMPVPVENTRPKAALNGYGQR